MTVLGWVIVILLTFPMWSKVLGYVIGLSIVLANPILKNKDHILAITISLATFVGLPIVIFSQSKDYLIFLLFLILFFGSIIYSFFILIKKMNK